MSKNGRKPQENIRMLHDRVLVQRIPEVEGTIVLAETAKRKPLKAKVLAVGPGRMVDGCFHPTAVKVGDIVFLSPAVNIDYSDIIEREEGVTVINEQDILGVFNA